MVMVGSDGFGLSLQEPNTEEGEKTPLTVAQKKAQNIMQSFENPFRMVSRAAAPGRQELRGVLQPRVLSPGRKAGLWRGSPSAPAYQSSKVSRSGLLS